MSQEDVPLAGRNILTQTSLRRSHVLSVLGLALAMRLVVLWIVVTRYPPQWLFTRGMEMGLLAKSLLAGEGLSSPFGGHTGPTALIAPVYPILVAMAFKIFGSFSLASAVAIMSVQIAINLFTIWLIMYIARQLFNQGAATMAGLVWACSLPLVWMPTILWETSLSSCLLTGLLALVFRLRKQPQLAASHWIILGAYCGFSALVNPALLPSAVAISLWLVYRSRNRAGYAPLLSLLTFVLIFCPWPIRNARAFHAFIPLRTTVGFELWMGNRDGATGFLDESLFPMFNQSELADYKAQGEVAYSSHKSELARQFILHHHADFLRLTAARTLRFWSGTGTQHGSIFFAIHALFTTFTGITGLVLLVRFRRFATAIFFVLPLAFFPLPYLITHAEFRYRIVIDPLLTILSGLAVSELCSLLTRVSLRTHSDLGHTTLHSETTAWRQI